MKKSAPTRKLPGAVWNATQACTYRFVTPIQYARGLPVIQAAHQHNVCA
ncbi:hypothetical protein [Ktedonosporobacter rubrisoli]|nr:hypothetical protein [Ktedonosporobacter rubrisoli]